MPIKFFAPILMTALAAAGLTIWLATFLAGSNQVLSVNWAILFPVVLGVFCVWRVIAQRINRSKMADSDTSI